MKILVIGTNYEFITWNDTYCFTIVDTKINDGWEDVEKDLREKGHHETSSPHWCFEIYE